MAKRDEGFTISQIYRETLRRITHYEGLVAEGTCVDEASNFARWLRFSGVLSLIVDQPQPAPLATDGPGLEMRVSRLISACGEVYRRCGRAEQPHYQKSDIESIRDQLTQIQARLSCAPTAEPVLRVA